ncbi:MULTISPECIES: DUF2797 domain-containing protein [Flavobacterium]|uniref:DUF2797 domain-containing protein n=2 Tax=Flavobacterium TaxID=237 RepID=A0AA94F0J2_9FLAO|nr:MULTISPECIES: DUF2797 domain-containing protein [Flavobacterium]OXA83054.1 hypothetical protein B0A56_02875 [Flavobacterium columnare NBRC 100251 = ATCC 23463]AMA50163.1 hypothetical protein AWN65_12185 [Flavobacterium covae]AND64317.1 hypothetical protein AX766_07775 [Flavobacterium covae]MCH4829378.1 DUF2797 domain-containing protein [Flavobacterium columnare]MCH4834154.1 DUF2797 domain-containing protein [Flavobacterium columnare]
MTFQGVLTKMQTEFVNPIEYYLVLENSFLNINQLLGKPITFLHLGYQCLECGKEKKIFRQGFCYDCFMASASAGDWIMKPELSKAHLDVEDRDLEYEKKVQLQPHVVYLALSSEVKVGVTRKTQVPTRWIDQGAVQAIPIVEVPNRYLAGITEVALKNKYADKTNWQRMLKNEVPDVDLILERNNLQSILPQEVQEYYHPVADDLYEIQYPVLEYPKKVMSLNLEKTPHYTGILKGIKGQYLIFEDNTVFNIRTYEGYVVKIEL